MRTQKITALALASILALPAVTLGETDAYNTYEVVPLAPVATSTVRSIFDVPERPEREGAINNVPGAIYVGEYGVLNQNPDLIVSSAVVTPQGLTFTLLPPTEGNASFNIGDLYIILTSGNFSTEELFMSDTQTQWLSLSELSFSAGMADNGHISISVTFDEAITLSNLLMVSLTPFNTNNLDPFDEIDWNNFVPPATIITHQEVLDNFFPWNNTGTGGDWHHGHWGVSREDFDSNLDYVLHRTHAHSGGEHVLPYVHLLSPEHQITVGGFTIRALATLGLTHEAPQPEQPRHTTVQTVVSITAQDIQWSDLSWDNALTFYTEDFSPWNLEIVGDFVPRPWLNVAHAEFFDPETNTAYFNIHSTDWDVLDAARVGITFAQLLTGQEHHFEEHTDLGLADILANHTPVFGSALTNPMLRMTGSWGGIHSDEFLARRGFSPWELMEEVGHLRENQLGIVLAEGITLSNMAMLDDELLMVQLRTEGFNHWENPVTRSHFNFHSNNWEMPGVHPLANQAFQETDGDFNPINPDVMYETYLFYVSEGADLNELVLSLSHTWFSNIYELSGDLSFAAPTKVNAVFATDPLTFMFNNQLLTTALVTLNPHSLNIQALSEVSFEDFFAERLHHGLEGEDITITLTMKDGEVFTLEPWNINGHYWDGTLSLWGHFFPSINPFDVAYATVNGTQISLIS